MEYKIQKINDSSILSLTGLAAQAKTEGYNFVQRTIDEWQAGKNNFSKTGEFLLGVFDGDNCIAIGGLNIDPYANDTRVCRLRHLYVSPKCRRVGIAKILLEKIINDAQNYFNVLRLSAHKPARSNEPAARLYESMGFIQDEGDHQTHLLNLK